MSDSAQHIGDLVQHLFRREAGRMTSRLVRIFGAHRLDLVEDAVQFSLLQALQHWSFTGVPDSPQAWLMRVASNRALDTVRGERTLRSLDAEDETVLREVEALSLREPPAVRNFPDEVVDEQLAMIFVCCHPALSRSASIALTLKAVCGFGVTEIARAFLTSETTIAQRLVRAKRLIREQHVEFEVPAPEGLQERLAPVLEVLYALFTEGYAPTSGDDLVNADLCAEAIRLTRLVTDNVATARPECHALLALMLFQAARSASRADSAGDLLLLEEQDRNRWDRSMIGLGMLHLQTAAQGDRLTSYHLQAEIAAIHVSTEHADRARWPRILALYDALRVMQPSPIVLANRAIALSQVEGAAAGLAALNEIRPDQAIQNYPFFPMARGEFLRNLGRSDEARVCFEQALTRARTEPERRFIRRKLAPLVSAPQDNTRCTS